MLNCRQRRLKHRILVEHAPGCRLIDAKRVINRELNIGVEQAARAPIVVEVTARHAPLRGWTRSRRAGSIRHAKLRSGAERDMRW